MEQRVSFVFLHHGRVIDSNLIEYQYYDIKTATVRIRTKGGQVYEGVAHPISANVIMRLIGSDMVDANLRNLRKKP